MIPHDDQRHMGEESAEVLHEEAILERRLEHDGAAWRARVPANDRLNAWVRTLPGEMPQATGLEPTVSRYRPGKATEAASITSGKERDDMKERHPRLGRGWAAGAAAVLVVGVIALLLVSTRAFGHSGPSAFGHPGSSGEGTEGVGPGTPTSSPPAWAPTPGPNPYVTSVVTAKGVDAAGQPVDPTSQFMANQPVYVIVRIRNAPTGRHTVTIRWYLNGARLRLPSTETSTVDVPVPVAPGATVNFTWSYSSAGRGTAEIYWDLPPNTPDDYAHDWLAQTVAFDIG